MADSMKTIGCVSKIVILIGLISIYGVNAQGPVGAPAPTVSVGPAIAPISGPPAAPIAPASVPSSSVTPAAAPALPGFIPALAPFDALVPSPVSRPPTPSPAQAPTPTRGPTNAPVPASRPVFAPIPVPNAPSAFPATATPPPSVLSGQTSANASVQMTGPSARFMLLLASIVLTALLW
ncbi:hypothetical protein MPTK1_2g09000 [Marchantia polymorpha subsp. ruderalis]|uniref:Uncharacterized protein n=1 Tax=Marchantia polymorpha TaxID=3197 RepID=A0A2R6XH26_MARPO|nr:hypothetical protein MARPO_0015s0184 [Marchantia polymorpha]BBN01638.1 hypothetical protein Mp_2g09000 [Marchantia polymorpha subsp. ruderalis]|eukprot:PTQ45404.1 hypothetical protein MARPO_0015s0184 [Marchantia polymorpha]